MASSAAMGKFKPKSRARVVSVPGKIFIGGLENDVSEATLEDYFRKYGEIVDSVIMKDIYTHKPRGFGFITYADPAVVDDVIEGTHVINGKRVDIRRYISKAAVAQNDLKTIFVGGIPTTVTEDQFKGFFSKHGKVVEHCIIRDYANNRSGGYGFVVFESVKDVVDLLSKGNVIELAGSQVEIKSAEKPKKHYAAPFGEPRARPIKDDFAGFNSSYGRYRLGSDPYMAPCSLGGRLAGYDDDYGGPGELGDGYGGGLGAYIGESLLGYPGRMRSYRARSAPGYGRYTREEGLGGYCGSGYGGGGGGGGYESRTGYGYRHGGFDAGRGRYGGGSGYGGGGGGPGGYESRTGYGYSSGGFDAGRRRYGCGGRYHPYGPRAEEKRGDSSIAA